MQLPPEDEVVMVSGHPPIQAQKIRYYRDVHFKRRVLAPPVLVSGRYVDAPQARADDWSGLATPGVPVNPTVSATTDGLVDDGGRQQQPELPDDGYDPSPPPISEDLLLLDDNALPPVPAQLDRRLQRASRVTALSPDDGIAL